MNLTAVAAAVSAALAGAVCFGTAWTLQGRTIDAIKLEAKDERIEQQRAARQVAERLANQVITAQNAAATRNTRIAADVGRAGDSGNGLRVASATAVRASTSDSEACRAVVAAYDIILAEGSSFIREVAGVADQCISDNKALTEAWPR